MKSNKEIAIKRRMAKAKAKRETLPIREVLREELLNVKGFAEYDEKINGNLSNLYMEFEKLNESVNALIEKNESGSAEIVAELKADESHAKLIDVNNSIIQLQSNLLEKGMRVKDFEKLETFTKQAIKSIQAIKIPTDVSIKNMPKGLATEKSINEINKNLANIAEQLEQYESNRPGQQPEDYMPFRRVVADGKRLRFDDSSWGSAGGGAGASIDTSGIITELQTINSLTPNEYDYIAVTYPTDTTEAYAYKQGGSGGTTVQTITVTYENATKENIISVART